MTGELVVVQDVVEVLAAGVEVGTRVYHVPPGQLVVGANARVDVGEDPEFAASIREHGVLQAISAYVLDDQLVVEMGQRRTVFAARAGLASVPVVVIPPPDEVRRLLEQVTENEHRAPLSTGERAAAVQQLALLGLTAEQLVRRTRLRRVDVDHALAVAASPAAAAAAAQHPLSLDQAAVLAEFDDEPDVVDDIAEAAATGRFDHAVEFHRERRRDDAEIERITAELRAAGVQLLDETTPRGAGARQLAALGISVGKHATCPGHAARPVQGGHHVDGRWEHEWYAVYWCTDPVGYGHVQTSEVAREQASLVAEQARQDRAEVIARNRAWRTASIVRRRWLGEFARARTTPAGAERWIAATLLVEQSRFGSTTGGVLERALYDRHRLLRDLLCRPQDPPSAESDPERVVQRAADVDELLGLLHRGSPKAALRLTCALLLAAWEARADVHVWRHPTPQHRHYLGQMIAWGYEPSDVEQLVMHLELTEPGAF